MLELLNGATVDLAVSAARHGEGLFETIRVRGGEALRLEAHLARLAEGAAFLGLAEPPGAGRVRAFWMAAGALTLPTRSTALTAIRSGLEFSNVRAVWLAGKISVAHTSLVRYCKTHSHAGVPFVSQRTLNPDRPFSTTMSFGLTGGRDASHGDAGTNAVCG